MIAKPVNGLRLGSQGKVIGFADYDGYRTDKPVQGGYVTLANLENRVRSQDVHIADIKVI